MQQVVSTTRDPAPSRLRYRMQRWMLTPAIRFGFRIGMPLALIVAATTTYLADQARRDQLVLFANDLWSSIQERPEFMVGVMAIDGAGTDLAEAIRKAVPLDLPTSSFDLDLQMIRDGVVALDPVKSASVRIRPGGVLQVDVVEREPAIVWRTREGVEVLDEAGAHIRSIPSRLLQPELPLIAGDHADRAVPEALELIQAAQPLRKRLRGLVRIGERRWDILLDRDQRILLPSDQPVRALERVIALGEAKDMLERDVSVIDMRLGERPTLRMTTDAVQNWWRIRETNGSGQ